jgi:hypothetical protein
MEGKGRKVGEWLDIVFVCLLVMSIVVRVCVCVGGSVGVCGVF